MAVSTTDTTVSGFVGKPNLNATYSVDPATGSAQMALPPGPAPAAQSVPTTEAAYSSVVAYSGVTTVGRAVAFICTAAGTATLTFTSGSMVIPVNVGLTVLPFACTNAVQTTGTMTLYKLI